MRSIKEIAFDSMQNRSHRTYRNRLLEGMNGDLPVEPSSNPWKERENDGSTIKMSYKFSNRESMKDFISSIQELEDRMQHFSKITILKKEVIIEDEVSSLRQIPSISKDFFAAIESIRESIEDE